MIADGQLITYSQWSLHFAIRVVICIIMQLAYILTEENIVTYVMVLIALIGLHSLSLKNTISTIVSLMIGLKFVWMMMALVLLIFELPPLTMTEIRWSVYKIEHLRLAVFMSAQMIFLLSILGDRLSGKHRLYVVDNRHIRLLSLFVVILTSYFINRGSFVVHGGYIGNINEYWGGLPALFVLSFSVWVLSQRNYGVSFLIIVNLIVLYWLSTGNRSEVLMVFLVGNAIYLFKRQAINNSVWRVFFALSVLIIGFVVFSLIGVIRRDGVGVLESNILNLIKNVIFKDDALSVSTIGSSIYSAVSAIDIAHSRGLLMGSTFYVQLMNSIPSFISLGPHRYSDPYFDYVSEYQTIGGYGLLGDSYLNFGVPGVILITSIFAILLRYLIIKCQGSYLSSWFFLSLVLYSPRIFYYGYVYLHKIVIFFVVIFIAWYFIKALSLNSKGL